MIASQKESKAFDKSLKTHPTNFFWSKDFFSYLLLTELIHDLNYLNYRTCDKRKWILKEMFLRNLSDFHAEIVCAFSKIWKISFRIYFLLSYVL